MNRSLLILFGSVTGNAEYCAEKAGREARTRGYDTTIENMADSDAQVLRDFETVLIITCTYGDGEPPDGAEAFHEAVVQTGGLSLGHLKYSVLALGDTNYEFFCKCGHDYDKALEEQGAQRFHPLVECDVDYDDPCDQWVAGVFAALAEERAMAA